MDHPPARNVAAWDRLCARRPTVAIGGLDAHQTGFRLGRRVLSPMRNDRMFRLPREAELRLIRDGRLERRLTGRTLEERTDEPGVYRVEAHLDRGGRTRTWILSNPVYLRPPEGAPSGA